MQMLWPLSSLLFDEQVVGRLALLDDVFLAEHGLQGEVGGRVLLQEAVQLGARRQRLVVVPERHLGTQSKGGPGKQTI